MAEPETPLLETAPPPEESAQTEPEKPQETPPLTVDAIRDALLPQVRKDVEAAYKAARRAEAKAETVPKRLEEKISRLEAALELLITKDMDEPSKKVFVAERALERERESRIVPDPEIERQRADLEFQGYAASVLAEEGIKADDITVAFNKYAAPAKSPADWKVALGHAIADYHKAEAKRAKDESADRERKAREEERTKLRNEQRKEEGPVDRGAPASSGLKDWSKATEEEVLAELERRSLRRASTLAG